MTAPMTWQIVTAPQRLTGKGLLDRLPHDLPSEQGGIPRPVGVSCPRAKPSIPLPESLAPTAQADQFRLGCFFGLDFSPDGSLLVIGAGPRGRPKPAFNGAYLCGCR